VTTICGRRLSDLTHFVTASALLVGASLFGGGCRKIKAIAYSPDGKMLAVVRDDKLSVHRLEGKGEPDQVAGEGVAEGRISWTQDGRYLLYATLAEGQWDVVAYDRHEGKKTVLASHRSRDWSPIAAGEGRVLFLSGRDTLSDIYLTSISGSEVRRLTRDDKLERLLCASAQAGRYAYVSTDEKGADTVVVAEIGKPAPAKITSRWDVVTELSLSPDGSWLGVVADGNIFLYEIEPHGLRTVIAWMKRPVTPRRVGSGAELAWSADSKRIAFRTADALMVRGVGKRSKARALVEGRAARSCIAFSPTGEGLAYATGTGERDSGDAVALVDEDGRRRWLSDALADLEVAARVAHAEGQLREERDILLLMKELGLSASQRDDLERQLLLVHEELGETDKAIEAALGMSSPDYAAAGRIALIRMKDPEKAEPWLTKAGDARSREYLDAIAEAGAAELDALVEAERAKLREDPKSALSWVSRVVRADSTLAWTARLAFQRARLARQAGASKEEIAAYHEDTLALFVDSPHRAEALMALGRAAALEAHNADAATAYFSEALAVTEDPTVRSERFVDCVFDIAGIGEAAHYAMLIKELEAGKDASNIGEAAVLAVDILDSDGLGNAANDVLRTFIDQFDIELEQLSGAVRVLEQLDRSIMDQADTRAIPEWFRGRFWVISQLVDVMPHKEIVKRMGALVLRRVDREGADSASEAVKAITRMGGESGEHLESAYCFLQGCEALRAGATGDALVWLRKSAELSDQEECARAFFRAEDLLESAPERAEEVQAWLQWTQESLGCVWGRFSSDMRRIAALADPDANCPEPLSTARTALMRARQSAGAYLARFPESAFSEEIAYRQLSLDTCFETGGTSLAQQADEDRRHRYARLERYRQFLRAHPAGEHFPRVFSLLMNELREDGYLWRAAGEAEELLDVVRLSETTERSYVPLVLVTLGDTLLDDVGDEVRAFTFYDRLGRDYENSSDWPKAQLAVARIAKTRAEKALAGGAPGASAKAVTHLREALLRIDAVSVKQPDHPLLQSGAGRVLRGDCLAKLWEIEKDAKHRARAQQHYVRAFVEFGGENEVVNAALLARVFSLLGDEDLKEIVAHNPTHLTDAWKKLDSWQRTRVDRLFPDMDFPN